ncbi:MAG TPA: NAD(P)-dependent oxidoreductase, partial [Steroidobacteraceae bacterium]|nr:NAD(P)-dependent oxidoreductase [Steroidobacteraceae bacterium]
MKVSMLGLGIMGAGMAGQIVAKGFEVSVWNRNPAKCTQLGNLGARVAASPADAARGADLVFAMLADDDASRGVWLGAEGALAAMRRDTIAIESSTLTIEWVRELAAAASSRGIGFLDAPVTGSKAQAESGMLAFLVGGPAELLERARPALAAMSSSIAHLGPSGSGAT